MQTDKDLHEKINQCDLSVIICEGSEESRREIFRRINTLGVPLSKYEVLNGLYNGEYLRGLSKYVEQDKDVKKVLGANTRGKNQYKILELLMQLKHFNDINDYVKANQSQSFESDQREIGRYIRFIKDIFNRYNELSIYFRLSMKYIKDVAIWKDHKDEINQHIGIYLKSVDAKLTDKNKEIEDIIVAIVNNISVDPKRLFSSDDKQTLLYKQTCYEGKYHCGGNCNKLFFKEELTVDHIDPWSKGGRTVLSNAQLLCRVCNSKKGNKIQY